MSKEIFFVTGLPRSGTAWMANFLTWADCFCYHDAFVGLEHVSDIKRKLESCPLRHVGNSDPMNVLVWKSLSKIFPLAKWVVIHRPQNECESSCEQLFGIPMKLGAMSACLAELAGKIFPFNLSMEDLSKPAALHLLLTYLGIDMPDERIDQLARMNVQVKRDLLRHIPSDIILQVSRLLKNERLLEGPTPFFGRTGTLRADIERPSRIGV